MYGTHWHGAFESDGFRRRFLTEVARLAGRHGFTVAPDTHFAAARERSLDLLGDLVEEHLEHGRALAARRVRAPPPASPSSRPAPRTPPDRQPRCSVRPPPRPTPALPMPIRTTASPRTPPACHVSRG